MVFDFASQSGDSGSSDLRNTPIFTNTPTDNVRINTPSDTTSNTAVTNLPTVEFAGALGQQPVFRTIARDGAPPIPQGSFPFSVPGESPTITPPQGQFAPVVNPFKQPGLLLLPEPSATLPGQFTEFPQAPKPQPQPGPFQPGPGPGPFKPDQPFRPIQPKPSPDSPDMRDKPLAPGPFAPAPMSASGFTADQVRSILSDRDKAIALNRGQKPTDRPGIGPMVPAPDGRNPFKPDATPDKVKPTKTEFLKEGEFDEAVKTAKESGRPLVLSFTRPGCGYCTQIENESWPSQKGTIENEAVRAKVNGAKSRDLAQKFGVRSYPTTIVVNPNTMEAVDKTVGMVGSEELGSFLQNAFQKMKGGG